jgi:hypothetical protein
MASFFFLNLSVNQIGDIFGNISWIFNWFNDISSVFFGAVKYLLFLILLTMSLLAFLKFKKHHAILKVNNSNDMTLEQKYSMKNKHLIIATVYLVFAFGILLDFLTYFMLVVLEPIPDRFAFQLVNYAGITNPWTLYGVVDPSSLGSPVETMVFYIFTYVSLVCFLDILVSVWLIITENIVHIKKAFFSLFTGVFFGFLVGFTTFLPLLL